jgi:glycosyltransferase 2 family protein
VGWIARVGLAGALLIYVLAKVDWSQAASLAEGMQLSWLIPFALMALVETSISVAKWRLLLRARGYELPFGRLFRYMVIGQFYSTALPSSVGGDAARVIALNRDVQDVRLALASIVMERLTGMAVLVVIAVVAVVSSANVWSDWSLMGMAGLGVAAFLGVSVAVLSPTAVGLLRAVLGGVAVIRGAIEQLGRFQEALWVYRDRPNALLGAIGWSVAFNAAAMLNVYLAGRALGVVLPAPVLIVAVPLILIIALLPLTPGGLGVVQWAYVASFGVFGLSAALALALSLLVALKHLLWACGGYLVCTMIGSGLSRRDLRQSEVAEPRTPGGGGDRPIVVAVDARSEMRSGAGVYVRNLVPRLLEHAGPDRRLCVIRYQHQGFQTASPYVEFIDAPHGSPFTVLLWSHLMLPRLLRKHRVSLYHTLKLLAPFNLSVPTVHTVGAITMPYKGDFPLPWLQRVYWSYVGSHRFRSSIRLIAVSKFIAAFLHDRLGVVTSRVDTIYSGFDFVPGAADGEGSLPHPRPYVLCVGNVLPVKNHQTVVRAFAQIVGQVDCDLLIAGRFDTPHGAYVRCLIDQHGLAGRVHLLGFVPARALQQLFARATALLHPSLSEGFGLATLEALAFGVPVIASDRGANRELCGDAALYLDEPHDDRTLARLLLTLLTDPEQQERQGAAAFARSRQFDWLITAQQTWQTYERALAEMSS